MDRLEAYEKVNKAETYEELAEIIESLADEEGNIQGRTRKFKADKMAFFCRNFKTYTYPNVLTREFGIRQQAIYIYYYEKLKSSS